jgi:tRNA threonylcarbamoyl adenosine modification protein YeaZ
VTARDPWLLAIDTATSRVIVAAGRPDGTLLLTSSAAAEHRHGERVLPAIGRLMDDAALDRGSLAAIVVGTGPGAFTGLRVGLATAKTLAHELRIPVAGVSTGEALLEAAAVISDGNASIDGPVTALLLPAGPHDRVEVRPGASPRLLAAGAEPSIEPGTLTIAVDLDGRATADAVRRGADALDGLAAALLRLGAARLATGSDDPARLVPEYVMLPRGVDSLDLEGGVSWSSDRP